MIQAADTTTGPNFQVFTLVDTTAGVRQTVTVTIGLPDGLRWGSDAPDPAEGCTGTAPAVCKQALTDIGAGTVGGGYFWDVIADRPQWR